MRFEIFKALKSFNSYISVKPENVFLTFFTFLTFIYVVVRFNLVLGHLRGRIKELYMSGKTCQKHADLDMLKSQIWQNSSTNLC